jgi:hypothetical protein
MKILRDPNQSTDAENFDQAFQVRGRHNLLYDVDLPPSLPQEILIQMVSKFRNALSLQLHGLTNGQPTDHHRGDSFQTDSGLSFLSLSSVDPLDVVDNALDGRGARAT